MKQYIVATIDESKAQFYMLEPAIFPEFQSGPNLIECGELHNSTAELRGEELWANVKTGRNRGAASQLHSYDDGRQRHLIEYERRFIQTLATEINHLVRSLRADCLLLSADPQIIGLLRKVLIPALPPNLEVTEIGKELGEFSPMELHEYLAGKGYLPPRNNIKSQRQ